MELTRRCDYACRIMRSAYRHRDQYVSIAQIAEEEDVPYAFARAIQHDLATAGYVKTARGARGGLCLAVDPADVTVEDMLRTMQESISLSPCSADSSFCGKSSHCAFNKVWIAADLLTSALFSSLTLKDVFEADSEDYFTRNALKAAATALTAVDAYDAVAKE